MGDPRFNLQCPLGEKVFHEEDVQNASEKAIHKQYWPFRRSSILGSYALHSTVLIIPIIYKIRKSVEGLPILMSNNEVYKQLNAG